MAAEASSPLRAWSLKTPRCGPNTACRRVPPGARIQALLHASNTELVRLRAADPRESGWGDAAARKFNLDSLA